MKRYYTKFDGSWWIDREPGEEDLDPIQLNTHQAMLDLINGRGEELGLLKPGILCYILEYQGYPTVETHGGTVSDEVTYRMIESVIDDHYDNELSESFVEYFLDAIPPAVIQSLQQNESERHLLKKLMLHKDRDIRVWTIQALGSKTP